MQYSSATAPVRLRRKAAALMLLGIAAVLSGCATDGATPNPLTGPAANKQGPVQPAEPPMTRSRAATECWMATENGHAGDNLDKRADAVTKCIDDKMKKAATAPKT